eukprot:EG_transcript_13833
MEKAQMAACRREGGENNIQGRKADWGAWKDCDDTADKKLPASKQCEAPAVADVRWTACQTAHAAGTGWRAFGWEERCGNWWATGTPYRRTSSHRPRSLPTEMHSAGGC